MMSDWEDNFGAGYSAESLISSINHSNRMEARENERRERSHRPQRSGARNPYPTFGAQGRQELRFTDFDEALAWEKDNPGLVFTRKRDGDGWIVRTYPDGKITDG